MDSLGPLLLFNRLNSPNHAYVAFADFSNRRREVDTLSQILPCLAYMGILLFS